MPFMPSHREPSLNGDSSSFASPILTANESEHNESSRSSQEGGCGAHPTSIVNESDDSESSESDNGEHTGTNGTSQSENAKSASSGTKDSFIRSLGRAETVAVLRTKAFVYCVLVVAAALVGLATCRYVLDSENDDFEREVSPAALVPQFVHTLVLVPDFTIPLLCSHCLV
jgi:hypothetical protein